MVGANGAGKTTVINHINGVFRGDKGDVYIDGEKVYENEKIMKFCKFTIVKGALIYKVKINYAPAYLMQSLANMTTGLGPLLGHAISGKYATAKNSFIASSGKVVVGGLAHPHMQPTYYLIARNNFLPLK